MSLPLLRRALAAAFPHEDLAVGAHPMHPDVLVVSWVDGPGAHSVNPVVDLLEHRGQLTGAVVYQRTLAPAALAALLLSTCGVPLTVAAVVDDAHRRDLPDPQDAVWGPARLLAGAAGLTGPVSDDGTEHAVTALLAVLASAGLATWRDTAAAVLSEAGGPPR